MSTIIDCDRSRAGAILEIFNHAIANTTALYEYAAWDGARMASWFEAKEHGRYPIVGVTDDRDRLMGFASYGPFRLRPAYKYSIEHSVYVHHEHRGKGLGKTLLAAIIERARQQDYHCMVGGIDKDNAISIALHEQFGFEHCGTVKHAGFKFGRWLDLVFYQKLLDTPARPIDG